MKAPNRRLSGNGSAQARRNRGGIQGKLSPNLFMPLKVFVLGKIGLNI